MSIRTRIAVNGNFVADSGSPSLFKMGVVLSYRIPRSVLRMARFDKSPIIIGGCGRSGTTLLMSILSAWPEIFVFPRETAIFTNLRGRQHLNNENIRRLYLKLAFQTIPRSARRWCEKTPRNVYCFGDLLARYNEDIRLIHLIRDGRDVVTSRHPTCPTEYWVSPQRWVEDVRQGLRYQNVPNVMTLKYEDIVRDFDSVMMRLSAFLDIPEVLSSGWYKQATVRNDVAWFEDVRPVHTDSIGKWRRPEHAQRHREFMENEDAVALLKQLGYSV